MKEALIYDTDNHEQIEINIEKGEFSAHYEPDYTYRISNQKYESILLTDIQVDWLIKRLKAMREED